MRIFLVLLLTAFSFSIQAEPWSFDGHLKYRFDFSDFPSESLNALLDTTTARDHSIDFRLNVSARWAPWQTQIHYEFLGLAGDGPAFRKRAPRLNQAPLPEDQRRLFDLSQKVHEGSRSEAVHRLDRLFLAYSQGDLVLRGGRQAVSWGNGLVFQPLDIFSPFAPLAVEKDYKSGDDMVYGQWLFSSGADLQGIFLPRREPSSHKLRSDQSTLATKYHGFWGAIDYDLYSARHFGESLLGLGLSGDFGGAVWRMDASLTRLKDKSSAVSLLVNLDYSWVFFEHNYYAFVEYFRNGVGEPRSYQDFNTDLFVRLERGELFNIGRDYLSFGLRVEIMPLLNGYATLLQNLNDSSGFLQLRGLYDWTDQRQLQIGLDLPYGAFGSEFGGIFLPQFAAFATPAARVYVRLTQFF